MNLSRAIKINNCINYDQSIKIGTGLFYTIKMLKVKIFEREMTSFWLKLRFIWTRHTPKISYHKMIIIIAH